MTLEEFVQDMTKQVQGFRAFWKAGDPKEHFPEDMGASDWVEQLLFYMEEADRERGMK